MGSFMSALRKARGLTQQEVADRLLVSNKTVSKWERDEGCPEIMMLPAIAELFEVTVDELLKGERIIKVREEDKPSRKGEQAVRYMLTKAMARFKNLSTVSIFTGIICAALSNILWLISRNDSRAIVSMVLMFLSAVPLLIEIIAYNNVKGVLRGEEDIFPEKLLNESKRSAVTYMTVSVLVSVTAILSNLTAFIDEFHPIITLVPSVAVGGIAAFIVYLLLRKSMELDEAERKEYSEKFMHFKKRLTKVTAILSVSVIILAGLFPFVSVWLESLQTVSFVFTDEVGSEYEAFEEAEEEYYKLKSFFENGTELYTIQHEDEKNLIMWKVGIIPEKNADGSYRITGVEALGFDSVEAKAFDTEAEKEEFKKKYVLINEEVPTNFFEKNIRFDDGTLTVYYKGHSSGMIGVLDIMPVFALGGSATAIVIALISMCIYNKKKKEYN